MQVIRDWGVLLSHGYFTLTPVEYRTLTLIHFPTDKLYRWNPSAPLIKELAKRKIEVVLITVEKHGPDWLGKNRRNYGHLVHERTAWYMAILEKCFS